MSAVVMLDAEVMETDVEPLTDAPKVRAPLCEERLTVVAVIVPEVLRAPGLEETLKEEPVLGESVVPPTVTLAE